MAQAVLTPQLLSDMGWGHIPVGRLLVPCLGGCPSTAWRGWMAGQTGFQGAEEKKSVFCLQFKITEVLI